MDILAVYHQEANDSYEPYNGVKALFNGDLHAADPGWAPRESWRIVSPYEIRYEPDGYKSSEAEV